MTTSSDLEAPAKAATAAPNGKFTSKEKSWILYDWANSVYATIIVAAVFPIYFTNIAKSAGAAGDVLWGYASSIATLLIAVSAPFLGAIADFRGMKKKLFTFFMLLGVVFTASLGLLSDYRMMLVGYVISYVGFAGSILFYDSFLTDVTTPLRMDRVSAYGFAMGYLGGSTIPFLISIALIMFGEKVGIDGTLAVRISCLLAAAWWFAFSIPMIRNVKQEHYEEKPAGALISSAFRNLKRTVRDIIGNKAILTFMLAYFFYIDGVNTVIHMATVYGSAIGLGATGMILALLVTQLVAVPCSILFGRLARKVGSIRMLTIAICVYLFICIVGFYMGYSLEPSQQAYDQDYTRHFQQAFNTTSAEPLAEGARDRYEDQKKALLTEGRGILSAETRAADFAELVEEQIELTKTVYPAESDQRVVATALTSFGKGMAVFFNNPTAAADYDKALNLAGMLFWAMAVLVGLVQGGIQAISRSFFGKLVPPKRSSEYFGFFDIFGKFAAVIGPALYAFSGAITGKPYIGILSLILLFVAGLVVMFIGRHYLAAAEASGRASENGSNVH